MTSYFAGRIVFFTKDYTHRQLRTAQGLPKITGIYTLSFLTVTYPSCTIKPIVLIFVISILLYIYEDISVFSFIGCNSVSFLSNAPLTNE